MLLALIGCSASQRHQYPLLTMPRRHSGNRCSGSTDCRGRGRRSAPSPRARRHRRSLRRHGQLNALRSAERLFAPFVDDIVRHLEEIVERHPLDRVALEQSSYQLLQIPRDFRDRHARCRRLPLGIPGALSLLIRKDNLVLAPLDPPEQLDVVLCPEGRLADTHLEGHRSDGPQICLGVILLVS